MRYRHLKNERVTGEVSRWDRDSLDEAIDTYERALDAVDRAIFDSATSILLQVLSRLGYVFDPNAEDRGADADTRG